MKHVYLALHGFILGKSKKKVHAIFVHFFIAILFLYILDAIAGFVLYRLEGVFLGDLGWWLVGITGVHDVVTFIIAMLLVVVGIFIAKLLIHLDAR